MNPPQSGYAKDIARSGAAERAWPPEDDAGILGRAFRLATHRADVPAPDRPDDGKAWLSSPWVLFGVAIFFIAIAFFTAVYFMRHATAPSAMPETLTAKTDFLATTTDTKGSLETVAGDPAGDAEASPKQNMVTEDAPPAPAPEPGPWLPDQAQMSDTKNWIPISRQADFRTFFFKDVNAKGSADARLAMLTNFNTAQTPPGSSTAYQSKLYIISINCSASLGEPVQIFWNTEKFALGDNMPMQLPPQKQKQFTADDPMFQFACR